MILRISKWAPCTVKRSEAVLIYCRAVVCDVVVTAKGTARKTARESILTEEREGGKEGGEDGGKQYSGRRQTIFHQGRGV